MSDNIDREVEELLKEPKCPECNCGVGTPKCYMDLSPAACGRWPLLDEWRKNTKAVAAWARKRERDPNWRNCPRCDSPSPRLHPAMQHEGEVQECSHPFHAAGDVKRLQTELAALREQAVWASDEDAAIRQLVATLRQEIEQWRNGVRRIISALGGSQPEFISFNAVCSVANALREENERLKAFESKVDEWSKRVEPKIDNAKVILETAAQEAIDLRQRLADAEREREQFREQYIDLVNETHAKEVNLLVERDDAHVALEKFAEEYSCHCGVRYPGSTEYHGHDCRNAVVQEFVAQFIAAKEGKDG